MALSDEVVIQIDGGTQYRRHILDLLTGTGMSYTLTDDPANDRIKIQINVSGALDSNAADIQPVGVQAAGVNTSGARADHVHSWGGKAFAAILGRQFT